MLTAVMTIFNVCLLFVLIVWVLDREDGRPRRTRVLRFRRPAPRVRRTVGAKPIRR